MDYLQTKGRIFDIQRYSVHDGPGIRTIVFLKGCVLRCRWCCNPESQEYKIQTMKVLGEDKVIGRDVTVEEMIKVVEEDRPYYRRSGGGLTLSGGESLCQSEFARDLLRAAKEHGINTALESMACAPFETIETILPYLDLYLMDIKHTNPAKHKEFTGRPNDLMMENARKVALSGKCKLIIRVPVIPTFNDTIEEIQGIARFADTLPGVEQLHLLNKTAVQELKDKAADPATRRVLELRQQLGKTSVTKYEAMQNAVCADGRVRGLLQYYGAGRTGRWAGRLVQVQNLPQNHLAGLGLVRELVRERDLETLELCDDSVPDVLSQLIRTAFVALHDRD